MNLPNKKKQNHWLWIIPSSLFGLFFLYVTYDIFITHFLAYRICHADPQPKTFINKTVEFPESIYWEDNIYPGYDEKDRILMIRNYLDGVHVKEMAVNAPDGTIYWFSATPEDWQTSRDIKAQKIQGHWINTLNAEAAAIAERGKTYNKATLPKMNYSVTFDVVPLTEYERRYLWSDEIRIVDEKADEVIGYNRRLMRRWYRFFPSLALTDDYHPEAMCGSSGLLKFDVKVFESSSRRVPIRSRKLSIDSL